MPRWLRYSVLISATFASIALLGLMLSLSDPRLFDRYFPFLLVLNVMIAGILIVVVAAMIIRLTRSYRQKQFGSRMTARLACITAIISVIPTATVYILSSAVISRSTDTDLNSRVETALDAGVHITQGILARRQNDAEALARQFAQSLSSTPVALMMNDLLKLLENHSGTEALVLTGTGSAVAAAGSRINVLMPDLPSPIQIKTARTAGIYSVVDGDTLFDFPDTEQPRNDLRIRVIVPIPVLQNAGTITELRNSLLLPSSSRQQLFLQITQPVEEEIALNAAKLVSGYRDYQQATYSRSSMKTLYTLTLSLTMLLAIFSSVAAALSFARRTTAPVMQLAKGTKRVATGDFMPIREFVGNNEINVLTRSFNAMIKEVSDARTGLEEQRLQAERAQAFLSAVLSNISSGVLVISRRKHIVSANLAARRIMGEEATEVGASLEDTIPELAASLDARCHDDQNGFSLEFELPREQGLVPLFLRCSPMPLEDEIGSVLIFDDVTQLIKAQRATAWGEVARRLAHEIKNPLTPIRLAAERLEWKMEPKLTDEKDLTLLHRTIATIVTQVDALKQMVNDFREYAKLPAANLRSTDLNDFLESIATLYSDAGHELRLMTDRMIPHIDADPAQLRQVLHNLISNSLEAKTGDDPIRITLRTEAMRSQYHPETIGAVKLSIEDNGSGFSDKILHAAFEPYVTTKPTGTGLGLPMVKKILDEHGASIVLKNLTDPQSGETAGALVEIMFKPSRSRKAAADESNH
ncbi:MAG: ATP-binding protein [Sutterella sp.]|nr:ATP-binding protein [Sutterella sp.]